MNPLIHLFLINILVAQRICLQGGRLRFNLWVGKIPWRREGKLTPVFLPKKSHGQKSLVGYSPKGHKESDTTEQLSIHTHTLFMTVLCLLIIRTV